MDVEQLRAEAVQVLIPAVVAPLQLGVAAVQVEAERRHPPQDGVDVLQLLAAAGASRSTVVISLAFTVNW